MTAAAEDFMSWSDKTIDIFEPGNDKEKAFLSTIKKEHLIRATEEFLKSERAINGRMCTK
jgi:hypothetical protein